MSYKSVANKTKETETFPFANWTVEVHRRAFRRSVAIYLYPQKPIKVVAGKMTSQKQIQEFLLSKKDWIEKNLTKFDALAIQFPAKKIKSYENFPFLGQSLPLRMSITVLKKTFVAIQEGELRLYIPQNQWSAEALSDEHPHLLNQIRTFYKREAIRKITERTEFWAQQMKLYPTSLKFREQRTRWGSCSSRGNINFNWRLIVFSPEVIDYVIVHELAHLKHMNHSDKFWNSVESHIPDYQVSIKALRDQQRNGDFLNLMPS
jgi:predicted metal-dependent hydrolase